MKKDWTYKKLGEVATIYDSQRKPVTKKDRKPGPYPYYGATGVQDYVDKYIFDGRYVLVGEDGARWSSNEKSAYIIEGKSWVNNHAHVLSFDNSIIDCFIVYYLNYSNLDPYITGAIIKKLTQKDLLSISFPIPPLSIQRSIVSELDLLHSVIEKKQEQLRALDNLAQSLFYQMFGDPITNPMGWEVKKLGEVVAEYCSLSYGIVQPGDHVENGIPVVRPVDLTNTYVFRKGLKCTSKEIASAYKRTVLRGNELLMCVRGTTGVVSIASSELVGCNTTRGITPIALGEKVSLWFVYHLLNMYSFQQLIASLTYGIALKQINMKDVRTLPIILPPLSLQQSFAAKASAIEEQKRFISQSIKDVESLLAQRMDHYFG